MKVDVKILKQPKLLRWPGDLPPGTVYSWGARAVMYLRTQTGSVQLTGDYEVLTMQHPHFNRHTNQPFAEVADATLTATYEV